MMLFSLHHVSTISQLDKIIVENVKTMRQDCMNEAARCLVFYLLQRQYQLKELQYVARTLNNPTLRLRVSQSSQITISGASYTPPTI